VSVIRLDLAYDGTGFHGWARQPRLRTVQGILEEALTKVAGERPVLSVAGRTDAGVHASGQVASFPASHDLHPERIQRALNGMLAPEVVVIRARSMPDSFDARHSATGREYRYRIDTAPVPSPFEARFVWHRPGRLGIGPMRRAAQDLVGEHDFAAFCRSRRSPVSTVRTLRRLAVGVRGHRVEIRAEANGFLHQMVRSLVGTLAAVGEGRIDPDAVPRILAAGDRSRAGPVAPPHGLTLVRVVYGRRSRGTPFGSSVPGHGRGNQAVT
jgi:tRNA pseudouridine38-40 synthase